jgi:2-oxoglutarate ferredoxin oxidoreductase subunit delta
VRVLARGKPDINAECCKGCGLCVKACPEGILELAETFNKQGHHYAVCGSPEHCTACMFCAIICPDTAIDIWRFAKAS